MLLESHFKLLTCIGPSGAPTTVNISPIGNNSVRVQWSPPAGPGLVRDYRVFYTDGSTTNAPTVVGGAFTAAEVSGLTLGVQYSITVQAFADFPSPNSTAATIMLNGETKSRIAVDNLTAEYNNSYYS